MYKNFHSQSGFSLVETLVAITILLIVITGPLTLVSNSAQSTNFANDQVMAYFLAQEGLELVQAARDDMLIETFDSGYAVVEDEQWDEFISNSGELQHCIGGSCGLELQTVLSGALAPAVNCQANSSNCRLYFNQNPNERARYTHDSSDGVATRYTRVISMNTGMSGQVEVVSRVTWRSDGQRAEQEVEAVTYLFNVYGR